MAELKGWVTPVSLRSTTPRAATPVPEPARSPPKAVAPSEDLSDVIDKWNAALYLFSPVLESRLRSYNNDPMVAIVESWKTIPYLVQRIRELEEKV